MKHTSIHGLIRTICKSLEKEGKCENWWGIILAMHYTDDQNTQVDRWAELKACEQSRKANYGSP